MKVVLLLPGYLDSPDYLHMLTFEKRLKSMKYVVERLDPCNLWKTGNVDNYTITNYIKQIRERVNFYKSKNAEEIVLIGHSIGGFTAIIAGNRINEVTKIIALCPPSDRDGSAHKWKDKGYRQSKRDIPGNPNEFRTFNIPYSYLDDGLQYSASDEVKKIQKPLMIFIALNDVIVSPSRTEEIVKNANDPYVVKMPNMGHDFRFSQNECNIVMAEIEKFLREYSA